MAKPVISANAHITEPPNTYADRIDRSVFKDRALYVVCDADGRDLFGIGGLAKPIPMGHFAAAGKPAGELKA